jgi:hypothetical protein
VEETPPKPKLRIRSWVIAVVAGLLIGACVGGIAYVFLQGFEESGEAKAELTTFLERISTGDVRGAYDQLTDETKLAIRFEDFARTPQEPQFSGFAKLKTVGWNINLQTGADTTLLYNGVITYQQGDQGELEAQLVKQSGVWKISSITVNR